MMIVDSYRSSTTARSRISSTAIQNFNVTIYKPPGSFLGMKLQSRLGLSQPPVITQLTRGLLAHSTGQLNAGDIVTHVNGMPMVGCSEDCALIQELRKGVASLTLTIQRSAWGRAMLNTARGGPSEETLVGNARSIAAEDARSSFVSTAFGESDRDGEAAAPKTDAPGLTREMLLAHVLREQDAPKQLGATMGLIMSKRVSQRARTHTHLPHTTTRRTSLSRSLLTTLIPPARLQEEAAPQRVAGINEPPAQGLVETGVGHP